ncbi:hypothetical protein LCI18_003635 [Fusarium solani-melongenae]|uniref:Uncharacterized protein n=1 Tax=Fusarium solani subsp. cucurbitae TaxID=2747967 RepID=A0ACD3YUS3_FUSSC|nr:hypothetical protein LCI18_003635 [Fusarium solani-melongenae]
MDNRHVSLSSHSELPPEILVQIFSYFEYSLPHTFTVDSIPGHAETLKSICQVSKHFKALAQPLLFRSVIIHGKSKSLDILIDVLSRSPHLGKLVKELDCNVRSNNLPSTLETHSQFARVRSNLEIPDEIADGISQGLSSEDTDTTHDAIVAFWLALMPNLAMLEIALPRCPHLVLSLVENTLAVTDTSLTRDQSACLSLLAHLEAIPGWPHDGSSPDSNLLRVGTFESFLKLPCLKTFFIQTAIWKQRESDQDYLMQDCRLERLCTAQLEIRPSGIQNLLSTCNLRSLSLGIDPIPDLDSRYYNIGDLLRAYGKNLEFLELRINGRWPGESLTEEAYVARRIGNLQTLSRLKHLELILWFTNDDMKNDTRYPTRLNLAENLPSSIEVFRAYLPFREENKEGLGKELCVLAETERFSSLREVYVATAPKFPRAIRRTGWTYCDKEDGCKIRPMRTATE